MWNGGSEPWERVGQGPRGKTLFGSRGQEKARNWTGQGRLGDAMKGQIYPKTQGWG
jgi:hypothetical protein